MTDKPTEALEAWQRVLERISILQSRSIEVEPVIEPLMDMYTIRAALDNPMTLPDLPDGWGYNSLTNSSTGAGQYWFVHIGREDFYKQCESHGTGYSIRQAALNAIAKIKGE
jgi:hypothetical protein